MSTAQKGENRPSSPAPGDKKKESREVVYASHGDKHYEIPLSAAQQYEAKDSHDEGGDDEVGGRHRVQTGLGFTYHSDWLHGTYVWITDGRSYRGYHWHPNPYSPYAYDMDNY